MKSKFIILIIAAVAIIVAAGVYFAFKTGLIKSSADVTGLPVTIMLAPSSGSYKVGDVFDAKIMLNTGGNAVAGAQAYLNYDPTKLEVLDQVADIPGDKSTTGIQIKPGTIFGTVPPANGISGKIIFSAVSLGAKYTGTGILATIKFKALAASTSEVTFNFTAGSTGESTLVGMDTLNQNILTGVSGGTYTITAATDNTVILSADPTTITSGGSSVLTWANATTVCTAKPDGWFDKTKVAGTATVKPTETTTYELTCDTVIRQAVVTVSATPIKPATVTLTADPTTITSGGSSTLTWANAASTCTATPTGWFNTAKAAGSATVKPTVTTTYKLVCGAVTKEAVVTVSATACTAPTSETRTQTCPTGQTGSITEKRTKGTAPTCAWKDWAETVNTCVTTVATSTDTVTPVDTTDTTTTPVAVTTTESATTGPETPLMAGGLLSVVLGAFYLIKRRLA